MKILPGLKKTHFYIKTKRFLKQLIGEDVRLSQQISCSRTCFGNWCINPDKITAQSVVYSLGVGEDTIFDLGIIEKFGVKVHAFDPTPNTIEWLKQKQMPSGFIFHPYGVSGRDEKIKIFPRVSKRGKRSSTMFTVCAEDSDASKGIEVEMRSFQKIVSELGHNKIDILKMDIEGAEYEVVNAMLDSGVEVTQLLVEFHHRFKSIGTQATLDLVRRLNENGYFIFHISITGMEYSFIKSS